MNNINTASIQEHEMSETLKVVGTPWAEVYVGTGRYTGRLSDQPVRMDTGMVAPGWTYVGEMTEAEFTAEFEWRQHAFCHTPQNADFSCPHCEAAGWVK